MEAYLYRCSIIHASDIKQQHIIEFLNGSKKLLSNSG